MMPRRHRPSRSLWHDCSANAAVEFAILLPLLLLLVTATVDLGLGFQEKMKLQSAVNSGLRHVMQTQGNDIATTRQIIAYGIGADRQADIEVSTFCRCSATDRSCVTVCEPDRDRFALARATLPYRTEIFEIEMTLEADFEVYVGQVE